VYVVGRTEKQGSSAQKEDNVTSRYLWCGVLIVALSAAVSPNAEAQTGGDKIVSNGTIAGVLIGAVAVVVIVAYVVIHESTKKRSITGCVIPAGNGMSVTDEKDKRSYALSGNTTDVKAGDRVTLQGKRIKPKDAGKAVAWETKTISKDFGACQPTT
jgi:hypothetical protein